MALTSMHSVCTTLPATPTTSLFSSSHPSDKSNSICAQPAAYFHKQLPETHTKKTLKSSSLNGSAVSGKKKQLIHQKSLLNITCDALPKLESESDVDGITIAARRTVVERVGNSAPNGTAKATMNRVVNGASKGDGNGASFATHLDSGKRVTNGKLNGVTNGVANGVATKLVANNVAYPKVLIDWVDEEEKLERRADDKESTFPISGSRIVDYLRGKNILLTGATGFLAKALVEKILREQPDVGHIYLVIQPRSTASATQRLEGQVIGSQIFDLLRDAHSDDYADFMSQKLTAVSGSLSQEDLGIDPHVLAELAGTVDVIVNSAATTTFDERYDVSLGINTRGSQRLLEFAKSCKKLQLLVQISTAYTNGKREGHAAEKPFFQGESVARELAGGKEGPRVDVAAEIALAQRVLAEAEEEARAMEEAEGPAFVTKRMMALGLERANMHGWQDVYVFTKAMAEMCLSEARHELPIVVVRPSIVESAVTEPMTGWMEGIRMCDPVFIAYGKGQLAGFLADKSGVLDLVPVDYVINAILATLPKNAGRPGLTVYQVATSVANPLVISRAAEAITDHFVEAPMMDRHGQPVQVKPIKVFDSRLAFTLHMLLKYQLPFQFQRLFQPSTGMVQKRNNIMLKTMQQLLHLAGIYAPYTFYNCRFDASNTQQLFAELSPEDQKRFNFDLTQIEWHHYLTKVHLPGLRKFVLKGRGSKLS